MIRMVQIIWTYKRTRHKDYKKYGAILLKVWMLLCNVQTLRKIAPCQKI